MPSATLDGLDLLLARVLAEYPAGHPIIPSKATELWDDFARNAFITGEAPDSYTNYVYGLLKSSGLIQRGSISSGTWIADSKSAMKKALVGADSRRGQAIKFYISGDTLDNIGNSLSSGDGYFGAAGLSKPWLASRTGTAASTDDLVAEIAYPNSPSHVYYYGLTKTVLWLHSYNLASHLAPNSNQVKKFLRDLTGTEPDDPRERDAIIFWSDYFARYITPLKSAAASLGATLKKPLTVRDVQLAAWVLYSTKNLLKERPLKVSRKLTARTLEGYMHSDALNLGQLIERIGDIDLIDPYASDLYSFLSGLP
jgi:hypothetical protein